MLAASDLEPLVLADGSRIDPTTGKRIQENKPKFVEVPAPSVAQALVIKARKSVADLPAPPAQLTGIALVAFYTLFGLSDLEIALACDNKVNVEQIKHIRKLDPYIEFMSTAKQNMLETEANTVRDVFQKHAHTAANKIVNLVNDDETNEVLAFKAAQDILDRAGHRPVDTVLHKHSIEDDLNIVITTRNENVQIPTIDVDAIEVIDYGTVSSS